MDSPPEIKHGVHRIHREPWWSEDSPTQLLSWQRIHLQRRRPQVDFWVRKICCRRDRLPTPVFSGFLCGSAGKKSSCNVEDLDLIPGLGRSPGERKGYPLQDSGLENSTDCIVHEVAKSRTRLSDCHFHVLWYTNYISKSSIIHQKVTSFLCDQVYQVLLTGWIRWKLRTGHWFLQSGIIWQNHFILAGQISVGYKENREEVKQQAYISHWGLLLWETAEQMDEG